MTGEADGMNQGVDSRDGVMHYLNERSVIFNEETVGGRERETDGYTKYQYIIPTNTMGTTRRLLAALKQEAQLYLRLADRIK